MDAVKEIEKGKATIRIFQDENSESPREWDNLGTLAFFHGRYALGDVQSVLKSSDFTSWAEMESFLKSKGYVYLPVYMYDHSGLVLGTELTYPFNDRWDAGQVGFIFASPEKIRENFDVKRITAIHRERTRKALKGEIETLNQHLTGDVYGYQIIEDGEVKDSCWGFYGLETVEEEALAMVD